jgi:tripartite ATP-independent transporter DctP family solute receptor
MAFPKGAVLLALIAVAVGALAAVVPGRITRTGGRIVLMAADNHPLDYPTTQGLVFMDKYLREKTNGRISLDIFPNETLGPEKVSIEQTQLGIIDINRVNVGPLVQLAPELSVFVLPYIFRDVDHMRATLDGPIGDEMLHSMEPKNLIGLNYYDSGARCFYTSEKPISSPADLVGLKIRVMKSEIMMDMVEALGGSPTPMAFGEVYTSISTGVIDGAENNWPSYEDTRHYEVAKYYSVDEHSLSPELTVMSRRTWDRLAPADRELIMEAARASVPVQRKLWHERELAAEKKVRDQGCVVTEVPDKTAFIEAMKPVYQKHANSPRMRELVRRVREIK